PLGNDSSRRPCPMIRCNNCGTNNIDGSEYCDECGTKLDYNLQPRPHGRERIDPPVYPPSAVPSEPAQSNTIEGPPLLPPSFTTSTSIPKPALPVRDQRPPDSRVGDAGSGSGHHILSRRQNDSSPPAHGHRNAAEHRAVEPPRSMPPGDSSGAYGFSRGGTDELESHRPGPNSPEHPRIMARLVIERGGRIGKEFPITGIETNIGRWDADSGIFPDVDLDEDDPEAKISRRHARIVNHNGQYFIEDLGSTNGTFVNRGRRLLPGKRHMLQNGDEVIVGKTFLKFQVLR
ncbi:MAG TPA: FHA domain-containing protein, partial [Blastocatellia bacterium]|nr:FHA domain-containing protein [Blastocatellia bacterium]